MAEVSKDALGALSRVKYVSDARATMFIEAGITTVADLIVAAQSGQLQTMDGIGQKTQSLILDAAKIVADQDHASSASEDEDVNGVNEAPVDDVNDVNVPAEDVHVEVEREAISTSSEEEVAPTTAFDFLKANLVCPNCGHGHFDAHFSSVVCLACRREYTRHQGAIDLAPPHQSRGNLTQRVMETTFYAKYYENIMRPRLTGMVTNRSMTQEYELSTKYLSLDEDTRLLDVACGSGNFTRRFAHALNKMNAPDSSVIVGLDLSASMLEQASQLVEEEGLETRVTLVRGDATRIPMGHGTFNRLHCAAALHFMDEPQEVLRQFARVLESDGICVITTFIQGKGLLRRGMKRLAQIPTSFRWYKVETLHKHLNQAGFEVVTQSIEGDALTVKARRI